MYGGKKDKRFHGSRQVYYGEDVASAPAPTSGDGEWLQQGLSFVKEHGKDIGDAVSSLFKPKSKPKSKPKRSTSSRSSSSFYPMRYIPPEILEKMKQQQPAAMPVQAAPAPAPVTKSNTALWVAGGLTLTALLGGGAWWYTHRKGGANSGFSVSFFPRGDNEWNFILSDGSMGVVEVDVMTDSLVRDTGMNAETIHSMIDSGASIVIPQSLFNSLKSWGNRPYMGI